MRGVMLPQHRLGGNNLVGFFSGVQSRSWWGVLGVCTHTRGPRQEQTRAGSDKVHKVWQAINDDGGIKPSAGLHHKGGAEG